MRRGLRARALFVGGNGGVAASTTELEHVPTSENARRSIDALRGTWFRPLGATRTGASAPHSHKKGGQEAQAMGLRPFIQREQRQFGDERPGGERWAAHQQADFKRRGELAELAFLLQAPNLGSRCRSHMETVIGATSSSIRALGCFGCR